MCVYFEIECNDADGGATSPYSGNNYECRYRPVFCEDSWYSEKCPKSCGRCKGKEMCTVRMC